MNCVCTIWVLLIVKVREDFQNWCRAMFNGLTLSYIASILPRGIVPSGLGLQYCEDTKALCSKIQHSSNYYLSLSMIFWCLGWAFSKKVKKERETPKKKNLIWYKNVSSIDFLQIFKFTVWFVFRETGSLTSEKVLQKIYTSCPTDWNA